jgi:hypothetical protein
MLRIVLAFKPSQPHAEGPQFMGMVMAAVQVLTPHLLDGLLFQYAGHYGAV